MSNEIKQSLIAINKISHQILLCIFDVQNEIKENTSKKPEDKTTVVPTDPSNNYYDSLKRLTTKRDKLIHNLFEKELTEDIILEHELLDETVRLNEEVNKNSKACKLALSEHLIRLKKSSKVQKSYQKY